MLENIISKLKKFHGMHHGMVLLIVSWFGFLIYPLFGIYLSIRMDGYYSGREEKEAELRGFRLLDTSTWNKDQFEWSDFVTPAILAHMNIALMVWLTDWSFLIKIIEGS